MGVMGDGGSVLGKMAAEWAVSVQDASGHVEGYDGQRNEDEIEGEDQNESQKCDVSKNVDKVEERRDVENVLRWTGGGEGGDSAFD